MSCISWPKQPLGWGSPCHCLHMNSLRYSCYLLTIDQVSTDHRPSVDQLLTDKSVKYRRTIGEVSVNYRWMKSYIDRVSSDYRPSLDRLSTDYRPSVDRVSTDYWPLYRPIDRSTLPTVNMTRLKQRQIKYWGPLRINLLIMVIELSGVQFGLKSYAWFQNRTSAQRKVWFEIASMISDQNCTTRSSITTLLHPFWNRRI